MGSAAGPSPALGALSVAATSSGARAAGPSFVAAPISNPFLYNPLSLSSSPPSPSARVMLPRNLYQIQATTLNEKEKVSVDDSFDVKSFPAHESRQATVDSSEGTPGVVERWIIKFEQFVNVALSRLSRY